MTDKTACGCDKQEPEILSKFEEGKPADPTENMSEGDAKTWWQHHEKNKNQFKVACGETAKFEEGKPADPTENMSPEDAKTWWQHHERNKDQFKAAARVNLIPTADVRAKIPKVGETDDQKDPIVWIKYFSPYSGALWLITEWDGRDEMFGWAEMFPGGGELGYISLSELQNAKGMGGRLPLVERDLSWRPKSLSQAKASERRGSLLPHIRVATRSLSEIARDIRRNWPKPYFGAVPYLEAMRSLDDINDSYGADSAKSIVVYFLGNASTWKGPEAKRIKDELKAMTRSSRYGTVSPRLPAGARVVLRANPASRMLYTRGWLPEDGQAGTVTMMPLPGGRSTYMPGPGGGLLYVKFDNGTTMGVSPKDLIREGAGDKPSLEEQW